MPTKEDKIIIKQFKSGESSWWVNNKHYHLNELGEIVFICGGVSLQEEVDALKAFIKRNKKVFVKSIPNIFAQEEKIEWMTLTFGKYKGQTLDIIKDIEPKYCSWLYENTTDNKIKEQLKILLKK